MTNTATTFVTGVATAIRVPRSALPEMLEVVFPERGEEVAVVVRP
jgi:hypothetical protein